MSETINLNFEIPQGYYTKEDLENHIKNNILNFFDSPIHGYSNRWKFYNSIKKYN